MRPSNSASRKSGISILGRFSQLRVGHKIAAGYGLALSLAIGGATLGVIESAHQQQHDWKLVTTAKAERDLIQKLQDEAIRIRMQQYRLLDQHNEDTTLNQQLTQLAQSEPRIAPIWGEFKAFSINHQGTISSYGKEYRDRLLKSNHQVILRYFYELRKFAQETQKLEQAGKLKPEEYQMRLSDFINSPTSIAFAQLSDTLTEQAKLAGQTVRQKHTELATQQQQSMQLILGSLLTSAFVAGLLGWWISRAIGRSLSRVEQIAKSVVSTGDFSLRCRIDSKDEIGSLGESLNQLITWVELHTAELEANSQQLEAMVASQTQELRAIIDDLGDALLVCDRGTGQISRCNPAFTQMFGLTSSDVIGKLPQEILEADLVNLIQQHETDSTAQSAEVKLVNERQGQALISPILAADDRDNPIPVGAVILVRDVTQEREVEQMKTDFLSTVSHELRTPLTSVIGFAKLIHKKLEDTLFPLITTDDRKAQRSLKQVRENLQIIISEGDRLTCLINDVLDIAKIEAGKVEWHMGNHSIAEIVQQSVAATSVLAQSMRLPVNVEIAPDLPAVAADRDRIIQVLINLLSNAIKFTDTGSITCRVALVEAIEASSQPMVAISVRDTGAGLAPEDISLVFEKFKQVGEVMTNKPKGTGLGLPICRQIIEHHGGQIWAESTLGEGSTFYFTLPIADAPLPDNNPPVLPAQHNSSYPSLNSNIPNRSATAETATLIEPEEIIAGSKTILVIDDEPSIRQLLRQELELQNYQVEEASNGIQALEQIRTHPPDLIILDVMMPKMSGLDLAAILKANPETANIPIIILSIVEEQGRGYRLGVDRYQSKPVNMNTLFSDITLLLAQNSHPQRVLTIEGKVATINTLLSMLLEQGYSPIAQWNGQTGLNLAIDNQQHIVILDSGIPSTPIAADDPNVQTFRLDNGESSIFIVLRPQSGVNLPIINAPPTIPLPAADPSNDRHQLINQD
jgi:PAS domain S-box-containing protein